MKRNIHTKATVPHTAQGLSTAFDNINHKILQSALSELGISGTALGWLRSYLYGQTFKISWQVSNSHFLSTGVLQGYVLGPLVFSI